MNPYLSVLYQQLVNAISKLTSFRVTLYLTAITDIGFTLTAYLSAEIIFGHIGRIGSWGREHLLFFIMWMQAISALHTAIAAPNFWNFAAELKNGNLDFRLVRPLGSLFDTFTAIIRPMPIAILPFYFGLIFYFGSQLPIDPFQWCMFPIYFLLSFVVMVLVELMVAMSMFWTTSGDGVNFIRIQAQQLQRWPDFMYSRPLQIVFGRMIPLLAVVAVPMRVMLGTAEWWELPLMILTSVVLWFVVAALWRMGLFRYESSSS
jgi:ABC-2 type transport system permease protein